MFRINVLVVVLLVIAFFSASGYARNAEQPNVLWQKNYLSDTKIEDSNLRRSPFLYPTIAHVAGDSLTHVLIGLKHAGDNRVLFLDGHDGAIGKDLGLSGAMHYSLSLSHNAKEGIEELAAGLSDGYLNIYDARSGNLLRKIDHKKRILVVASDDINNDGTADYAVIGDNNTDMAVYDGQTGKRIWGSDFCKYVCNVAIDDVDRDGSKEIVAYQNKNTLVAANAITGETKWKQDLGKRRVMSLFSGENVASALGVATLDGRRVVVIGTVLGDIVIFDGQTGKKLNSKKEQAGYITNLSTGNLNGDGVFDIVVSSTDHKVYAMSGRDLRELWSFKTGDEVYSSPALGDMNNDGLLDVVIVSDDDRAYCIDGSTGKEIWAYAIGSDCQAGSAVLGDVNSDGFVDVIIGGTLNGNLLTLTTGAKCKKNEILWGKVFGNNRNTGAYGEP